jgi:hypothetical protein
VYDDLRTAAGGADSYWPWPCCSSRTSGESENLSPQTGVRTQENVSPPFATTIVGGAQPRLTMLLSNYRVSAKWTDLD